MRHYPENELHKTVAKYLDLVLKPTSWWTSIAHGEGGGFHRGQRWKAKGAKKGVPDIFILDNGFAHFIELKAEGGRVSPEQIQCQGAIRIAHGKCAVCRSVDDVAETLAEWGIRTRDASIRQLSAKAA
jgi:hypothetical protein